MSAPSAEDLLRAAFKYQDALTSYAFAMLQDWALAQDAVQETFIVLQKKHAEFRPGANVFTWARQILRFEALKIIRARGRESYVADEELFALVDAQFDEHLDADALARLEQQKGALQHCRARVCRACERDGPDGARRLTTSVCAANGEHRSAETVGRRFGEVGDSWNSSVRVLAGGGVGGLPGGAPFDPVSVQSFRTHRPTASHRGRVCDRNGNIGQPW